MKQIFRKPDTTLNLDKIADLLIELKSNYSNDRLQFDMNCSVHLAGDANKQKRIDLAEYLTGQRLPASKCKFHSVVDALKLKFDQPTLF